MMLPQLTLDPVRHTSSTATSYKFYRGPGDITRQSVILLDRSQRYLKVPLTLIAERMEDGQWVVTEVDIMTHGVGESIEDAVLDFQSMLLDYFKELVDSEDVLSPHLRRELNFLRAILVEENAL